MKLTKSEVKDVLQRRKKGERLQAIGDAHSISRQRVHQICVAHEVTEVPPPDRIYPEEEEAVCSICEKKFIRKGREVYLSVLKKTCSKECALAAKQRPKGGKHSKHEFVSMVCSGCGKQFERSNYLQSIVEIGNKSGKYYCTPGCYHKHRGGK